jgi:uncharacterized protein YceH (UPF0502 family)
VHFSELTAPEQRVLGCLIEKRLTTPDQYPLSLNSLRLACNQSTNRDPVTDYDESTVREAAQRISHYGLARLASGAGSRAVKYRHLAEEALGLPAADLAVLAVLLLRGPQTPGELKARAGRMARFDSLAATEESIARLIDRGYVRRIPRRPGQKEDRFEQLLGGDGELSFEPAGPPSAAARAEPVTESPGHRPALIEDLVGRVERLESELSALRVELAEVRAQSGR